MPCLFLNFVKQNSERRISMDKNKFQALLILLVPQVIKEISDKDNLSEVEATHLFYTSNLYAALEEEETKLWHLSPKALYQLYAEEKVTGKITYPEEA